MKESRLDLLLKRLGIQKVHTAIVIEPADFISEPVEHVELADTQLLTRAYLVRPYVLKDTSLL